MAKDQDKSIRETILKHSRKKFLEFGFRKVTVEEICKELGISKRTFYQHFSNRDGLVMAMVMDNVELFMPWIQKILESDLPAKDRIEMYFNFFTDYVSQNVSRPFLVDLDAHLPQVWEKLQEARRWFIMSMESVFEQGIREGVFRADLNPHLTTIMLVQLVDSLIQPEFLQANGLSFKEAATAVIDLVVKGIRAGVPA